MPRTARASIGGICYHGINRGNRQATVFEHYHTTGHVWQGRFKAFPIQNDDHRLTVLRYIERNPLRAKLGARAQDWSWSTLHARIQGLSREGFVDPGPVALPEGWVDWVNEPQSETELSRLRTSVNRGTPYGSKLWVERIASLLGLEFALRPRGRPPR